MGLHGQKSFKFINVFALIIVVLIVQQYINRDRQAKRNEYKEKAPQENTESNRLPASIPKTNPIPQTNESSLKPEEKKPFLKKVPEIEDENKNPIPRLRPRSLKVSTRLSDFEKFKSLKREKLVELQNEIPPELNGWNSLPDLIVLNETERKNETQILKFNTLHFKSGKNNPSTLQNFNAPIAVISPDTQKIGLISGRISVFHKLNVDREQFAIDHGLKIASAPENSRSATYILSNSSSLLQTRQELKNDSRTLTVEIEILSEGLKK